MKTIKEEEVAMRSPGVYPPFPQLMQLMRQPRNAETPNPRQIRLAPLEQSAGHNPRHEQDHHSFSYFKLDEPKKRDKTR